jgi:hypothetical protein
MITIWDLAKLLIFSDTEHRIFPRVEPENPLGKHSFREVLPPLSLTGTMSDTGLAQRLPLARLCRVGSDLRSFAGCAARICLPGSCAIHIDYVSSARSSFADALARGRGLS